MLLVLGGGGDQGGMHHLVPIHLWKASGTPDPAGIWAKWYMGYVSISVAPRAKPSMSIQMPSLKSPPELCTYMFLVSHPRPGLLQHTQI